MTAVHRVLNPARLAPAQGFSHVVVPGGGRTIYLGGQTAHGRNGNLDGETVVEQFDAAAANVVTALAEAGAAPEHLVSMQIFVTDAGAYRASLEEIGGVYRKHFGRHYPAVALLEVASLFDPEALIELVCIAVIPTDQVHC